MAARLTAFLVAAIVGVTLVAGLIVGAQREDDSGPIDLLIYNGRVYTGVVETPFAEAVAVRGNRIYRVGSNREIKRLRRRATTVIDAHGGSVLAGFTDAQASLPVRRPELIDASGSTVATTATASGEPERTPSAGGPVPATAVREAIEGAHRLGLTAVGVTLDGPEALEDYERLREGDGLALRVVADIHLVPPVADNVLERIDALRSAPESDPMVRVDGVVLDVSLPPDTPRSAKRRAKAPPAAPALSVLEDRLVQDLDRRGLPIVLRVEDERELTAALDALERAAAANPTPAAGRRHRLALAQPMAFDAARIKALGATVSLPLPAAWPAGDADASEPPVADRVAEGPPPLPGPMDGVRLVMVSETLADPRLGLQALVASQSPVSATDTAIVDSGVLRAALRALTTDASVAQGDARSRGTIAKDMLADLIVLSADLFSLAPDKLLDAVVTLTIVDGKVVYDREADAPEPPDRVAPA